MLTDVLKENSQLENLSDVKNVWAFGLELFFFHSKYNL